jgi:hypothetical protein
MGTEGFSTNSSKIVGSPSGMTGYYQLFGLPVFLGYQLFGLDGIWKR